MKRFYLQSAIVTASIRPFDNGCNDIIIPPSLQNHNTPQAALYQPSTISSQLTPATKTWSLAQVSLIFIRR